MNDPISIDTIRSLATKVAPSLIDPAKNLAINAKIKLEIRFQKGFEKYTEDQVDRYSKIKTILSSATPIPLRQIYVNLYLESKNNIVRDDDFVSKIYEHRRVLFTASAGSGKSMLMRYLYLHVLDTQSERLPIFLNLRDLNRKDKLSLFDLIVNKIQEHLEDFNESYLHYAMKIGKIILFLDSFDEIDHDKRIDKEKELNDLTAKYRDLCVFVSSRPAENFASWTNFHVFHVKPFSKRQVLALIEKVDFDKEIKDLFSTKIDENLFASHREFLINPLLTMMMLLTFSEFREIPGKIHLFYERAFDALYQKHDATKEGHFERKNIRNWKLTNLKGYLLTFV